MQARGYRDPDGYLADGGIYDAAADSWQPLPSECAPPVLANGEFTFTKWSETTGLVWGSPIVDGGSIGAEQGWVLTLP